MKALQKTNLTILIHSVVMSTALLFSGCGDAQESDTETTKIALGKALFNDANLSFSRNMSCASCHNPDAGFMDDKDNGVHGAVSLGDDGASLGDRNSPTVTYASFIPSLTQDDTGNFIGGQFWDGRANTLTDQAKGPFTNSVEMQMPDFASVVERLLENDAYAFAMQSIYGDTIFDSDEDAFNALADAIATFEASDELSTFDSRYDKAKNREITLTAQELLGEQLFRDLACASCHDDRVVDGELPLFTKFTYENTGIPKNSEVRLLNGKGDSFVDHGLLDNPDVTDNRQDGRFRTPGLRNVAVTAPYMHNGKFSDLKTVIHFYNTRDVVDAINPETALGWEDPEVNVNVVGAPRIGNLGLTDAEEEAIVAFLNTLTDERYESLIP
ncbi:MAG: cytochrome c peroxidase [Sulfurimonadaceae bacterium]